ncbi:MAG TPA: type II secretion system protein GspC [Gemmataceae bacterium]|nr:type II secretion system protein GspC [Gemmataceae bacterium]
MGRYLSWLANTALFVLCCFLVANTANSVFAALLTSEPVVAPPASKASPATGRDWADREVILKRNLFNASLLTPAIAAKDDEPLEATKLPLQLLGTAAHGDATASWAAVEDLQTRKTLIVRTGDTRLGAEVLRIGRRRIVLLENGQPRELALGEEGDEAQSPVAARNTGVRRTALAPRPPGTNREVANRVREIARNRFEVPQEQVQQVLQNPASIFSQVQLQPKYENGEMVGMQVNSVRPGSMFESLGIQGGDLITEVNGIPIDSAEASAAILTEFAKGGPVRVTAEGPDGQVRDLTIDAGAQ